MAVVRVATFNLESFDEAADGERPSLAQRADTPHRIRRWRPARFSSMVRLGLVAAVMSVGLVAAPTAAHAAPLTPQTFSDYDGDGRTDTAIWRPATHEWSIINSSTGTTRTQSWGDPGDWPVPGDYDGDGHTDIAIWRPSTGDWWIINSSTGIGVGTAVG